MQFISVVAALALAACSSNPTAPLNEEFTLGVGETVGVAGSGLSVKFVAVTEDSRCPASVQCIWAGNAQVKLEVRSDGQTSTLMLNTLMGAGEGVVGSYRIRLAALTPAPAAPGTTSAGAYRASLIVVRVGPICTMEARAALSVALVDSLSGAANGFNGVSVLARDGAFRDSSLIAAYSPPSGGSIGLAYERKGTYEVTVRAAGYKPWVRSSIVVQGDSCHVVTVQVIARLVH